MKKTQRGVTLTGLLMTSVIVALVAVAGMKVVPEYIEYGKIMSNMKALAQDASLKNGSVSDVRNAFNRRADIDHIQAVTGQDLDVGKEGGALVISVAYTKRISIFGPVSLLIDFEGSTAQ